MTRARSRKSEREIAKMAAQVMLPWNHPSLDGDRLKTQIKLLLCQTHTFAYGIEMRSIIPSIT